VKRNQGVMVVVVGWWCVCRLLCLARGDGRSSCLVVCVSFVTSEGRSRWPTAMEGWLWLGRNEATFTTTATTTTGGFCCHHPPKATMTTRRRRFFNFLYTGQFLIFLQYLMVTPVILNEYFQGFSSKRLQICSSEKEQQNTTLLLGSSNPTPRHACTPARAP